MRTPYPLRLAPDRTLRLQQMAACFPEAPGPWLGDHWPGGRSAALTRLSAIEAEAYASSRNHLSGAVTRLSPYLRHGCITLPEALTHVTQRFGKRARKLVSELGYRDYFRQVWYRFGEQIHEAMEAPKVALGEKPMPDFIRQGLTGLVCMDDIVQTLQQQGYVHNHARLWFAAYVIHWLKVDWREVADWFELQLLDGDLASNHLSWQWVASSFSSKPYFFNKDNIVQFGGQAWCAGCHVRCPFDHRYEDLQRRLFDTPPAETLAPPALTPLPHSALEEDKRHPPSLVWLHDEMLSPDHALLENKHPAVFVFDPARYAHWPLKRLQFMADSLAEIPEAILWVGNTKQVLSSLSQGQILSQQTPDLRLRQLVAGLDIAWRPEPRITETTLSDHQLMRFSRYWKVVEPALASRFYMA